MAHYPGVIFNVATNPESYHKWSPLKNNYNIARIKSKATEDTDRVREKLRETVYLPCPSVINSQNRLNLFIEPNLISFFL